MAASRQLRARLPWAATGLFAGSLTATALAAMLAAEVAVGLPADPAAARGPASASVPSRPIVRPGAVNASDAEREILRLVNRERAAAGLARYQPADDLLAVARSWASTLADAGELTHNPHLASQVAGYRVAGENVGYGPDAATVHDAFMNSPSHRANVVDADYTQAGIAVVDDGNGRLWVVEVFREPGRR